MEINEFIKTGLAEGWIRATNNTGVLRIDGGNQDYPVYEVRIDKLHYNALNGRIATFMSRYLSEHGELPALPEERDQVIEKMIEGDNPQRLKTTKLDIRAKGQQEVAIILSDGTVVDGNRRFTCLRQLSRDEGIPRFMRCYVLPDTYDERAIKGLELEIQLGRDEKVNYDAISRLNDIKEWVMSGRMSADEYGRHANKSKSQMRSDLNQIALIDEFLEFIDAPGAWHIAQDLKIQGPIESLSNKLARCKNEDEREDLKTVVFANLVAVPDGDRTRASRDMMNNLVAAIRSQDDYFVEQMNLAERVLEHIEERDEGMPVTTEFIRDKVRSDEDLLGAIKTSNLKNQLKTDNHTIKKNQVEAASKAMAELSVIQEELLPKLAIDQLEEMANCLAELASMAHGFETAVRDELGMRGVSGPVASSADGMRA